MDYDCPKEFDGVNVWQLEEVGPLSHCKVLGLDLPNGQVLDLGSHQHLGAKLDCTCPPAVTALKKQETRIRWWVAPLIAAQRVINIIPNKKSILNELDKTGSGQSSRATCSWLVISIMEVAA